MGSWVVFYTPELEMCSSDADYSLPLRNFKAFAAFLVFLAIYCMSAFLLSCSVFFSLAD
jgi:hypothetical protein